MRNLMRAVLESVFQVVLMAGLAHSARILYLHLCRSDGNSSGLISSIQIVFPG